MLSQNGSYSPKAGTCFVRKLIIGCSRFVSFFLFLRARVSNDDEAVSKETLRNRGHTALLGNRRYTGPLRTRCSHRILLQLRSLQQKPDDVGDGDRKPLDLTETRGKDTEGITRPSILKEAKEFTPRSPSNQNPRRIQTRDRAKRNYRTCLRPQTVMQQKKRNRRRRNSPR